MSLNFLYTGVSWVLLRWHQFFTLLGLSGSSGLTWALSIVFLVGTARMLLFPLFLKQVHHQRRMQRLQPQLQAIKRKHRGDRQAQQRAVLALQQQEGVNPLAGCLPLLVQIPIFIALFHVMRHMPESASLFGAPLAATMTNSRSAIESVLGGSYTSMMIVSVVVVILSAGASFYTQRLVRAAAPSHAEGAAAIVQKLIAVGIPASVVISGLFFPLGVLIYWCASNVWTLGQQLFINRFHPLVQRR